MEHTGQLGLGGGSQWAWPEPLKGRNQQGTLLAVHTPRESACEQTVGREGCTSQHYSTWLGGTQSWKQAQKRVIVKWIICGRWVHGALLKADAQCGGIATLPTSTSKLLWVEFLF